ncbi:MAG: alpha/beta fold hydrolase [Pseudomonadales bacterium]
MAGPTSHSYFSQRLRLHYVDWGNPEGPPMILIHGGRDHCRNWDWIAEHFKDEYHIIAPDLRGHGDSQWVIGSSYNQIDYVYDIAQLLNQKNMTPCVVIGHSLGGSISLLYTALHPQNVSKLIAIEGMGPPPSMLEERLNKPLDERLHDWMKDLRGLSARQVRRYDTLEDAYERMQSENPHLSESQARHLTIHGSNQNEDGTYSWKFDNYVRAFPPTGLPMEEVWKLYGQIQCPTMLVRGLESWASDPVADGRTGQFTCPLTVETFADAGHWVHHDQLDAFVKAVRGFLK